MWVGDILLERCKILSFLRRMMVMRMTPEVRDASGLVPRSASLVLLLHRE
jgi:hypothetical protein